jgi:hypothetical protein
MSVEPLRTLRDADDADEVMLSVGSAAFSVLSGSRVEN